jgi:hypothetical protein
LAQTRAIRAGAAAAACALAAGALALNRALVGVFYDDGLYAGLAAAIAGGQGSVHPHLPGTPAAIHYPPLYPLVLAPVFGLLPLAAAALAGKVLNLILAAGASGLVAWHAARIRLLGEGTSPWLAAAVVAAAAVAIPVLTTQSVLFAEPLFALLFAATVALADAPPGHWRPGTGAWLAGGVAALTLLTRTIGIAAGAGLVGYLLLFRRVPARQTLLAGVPVAIAAIAWGWWTLAHRDSIDPALAVNYGSYGEVIRQTGLGAFGASALDLPRPLGAITLGWLPAASLRWLVGLPALAVLVYGLWLLVRRSAVGLSLLGYLAILALWPFPPDRFLWAVLPWIAVAWTAGAVNLARQARLRAGVAVLAGVLGLGFLIYQGGGFARRAWAGPALEISANFSELLPWLRTLPADAVLATDDEALVWLYARRTSVPLYLYGYHGRDIVEPSPAEQRAYLERQGVTHIVLGSAGSGSARELRALIGAFPGWLTPVHAWSGGRWVYAVRPTGGNP